MFLLMLTYENQFEIKIVFTKYQNMQKQLNFYSPTFLIVFMFSIEEGWWDNFLYLQREMHEKKIECNNSKSQTIIESLDLPLLHFS